MDDINNSTGQWVDVIAPHKSVSITLPKPIEDYRDRWVSGRMDSIRKELKRLQTVMEDITGLPPAWVSDLTHWLEQEGCRVELFVPGPGGHTTGTRYITIKRVK